MRYYLKTFMFLVIAYATGFVTTYNYETNIKPMPDIMYFSSST